MNSADWFIGITSIGLGLASLILVLYYEKILPNIKKRKIFSKIISAYSEFIEEKYINGIFLRDNNDNDVEVEIGLLRSYNIDDLKVLNLSKDVFGVELFTNDGNLKSSTLNKLVRHKARHFPFPGTEFLEIMKYKSKKMLNMISNDDFLNEYKYSLSTQLSYIELYEKDFDFGSIGSVKTLINEMNIIVWFFIKKFKISRGVIVKSLINNFKDGEYSIYNNEDWESYISALVLLHFEENDYIYDSKYNNFLKWSINITSKVWISNIMIKMSSDNKNYYKHKLRMKKMKCFAKFSKKQKDDYIFKEDNKKQRKMMKKIMTNNL